MENYHTLYAFWDWTSEVEPDDLVAFMAMADVARRRSGYEACHMVLCDRIGEDGDDEAEWRLWNEFLPVVWLLPAGQQFSVCRSSTEIAAIAEIAGVHAFPPSSGGPNLTSGPDPARTGKFWIPGLAAATRHGESVQPLRTTHQARDYVRQWLDLRADGRLVFALSMGLAEQGRPAAAWSDFVRTLDADKILPVVVPDLETAGPTIGPDWGKAVCYTEASANVDLRMALYEECDLALLDDRLGKSLVLFGADTRCIAFGESDHLGPLALSMTQRLVAGPADAAVLTAEYGRMAKILALPPLGCPSMDR